MLLFNAAMAPDRVVFSPLPLSSIRRWNRYGWFGMAFAVGSLLWTDVPTHSQVETTPAPAVQRSGRIVLRQGSTGEQVAEVQALLKLLGFYSGPVDGTYQESTASAVSAFQQATGLPPDGVVGPATWNRLLPTVPAGVAPLPAPTPVAQQPGAVSPAPVPSPSPSPRPVASPAPRPTVAPTPRPSPSPSPRPTRSPAPRPTASPAPRPQTRPAPAPTPPSTPVDLPVLREGMRGPAVNQLQERLRAKGFYRGPIDGIFGPATSSAVRAAQVRFNLEPDGVVGPATWRALLRN